MKYLGIAIAAVGAAGLASQANAQTSPDKSVERIEQRIDRLDRLDTAERMRSRGAAEELPPPWALTIGVPFTYNSNVANAETGKDQAFHASPSISLARDWDLGSKVTLSTDVGGDLDVYTEFSDNDLSDWYANARVTIGDASTAIAPYADYLVLALYEKRFDAHIATLHGFTVGASRAWKSGEKGMLILDVNASRREATIKTLELNRLSVTGQYRFQIDERSKLIFAAGGQYSDYSGGVARKRNDKLLRASVTWDRALNSSLSLKLKAQFERNWSDTATKSYSVWDIGPTVTLTSRF